MNRTETVNIVFATDRNYIQHLCAALISLLANNRELSLAVTIISSGISVRQRRIIDRIAKPFDCRISHITISDQLFVELATEHTMYPKGIYYRLLIPDLIDARKLLYLDCDIIVNGSIRDLYDQDPGDAYVCAIEDPGFNRHKQLGMHRDAKYFNSGMMLINLAKWKETSLHKQVIDFIEKKPEAVWFPDQCGLNAIINGRWKKTPLKYNQQSSIFSDNFEQQFDCFDADELREAKNNPVIIHYTGGSKPWHSKNRHPYKHLYWHYLRMTPYRFAIYENLRPVNILKAMVPAEMKTAIKQQLKNLAQT